MLASPATRRGGSRRISPRCRNYHSIRAASEGGCALELSLSATRYEHREAQGAG